MRRGTRKIDCGSFFIVTMVIAGASGCSGDEDGGLCPAVFNYGISVEVTDATTGVPAADGAIGWAIEDTDSDSLEIICWADGALCLSGAGEREGTYTVLIYKPGYRTWSKSGVVVGSDECGVVTTVLRAELARQE